MDTDWYFIDPYTERVSEHPVSKYELKELFDGRKINKHCLIWNENYDDYIPISDVSNLLNFLQTNGNIASHAINEQKSNIKSTRNQLNVHQSREHQQMQSSVELDQIMQSLIARESAVYEKQLTIQKNKESSQNRNVMNWREYFTSNGVPYYHNIVTNHVQWEKPNCMKVGQELITSPNAIWKWIPNGYDGYIPALYIGISENGRKLIFETPGTKRIIKINKDCTAIYDVKWNLLKKSVSDLTFLTHVSPPYLLHNLRARFLDREIYTWTGEILISINPYGITYTSVFLFYVYVYAVYDK